MKNDNCTLRAFFVRFFDQPEQQPTPAATFTQAPAIVAGARRASLADLVTDCTTKPFTVWQEAAAVAQIVRG
jgi:hypothetical protein